MSELPRVVVVDGCRTPFLRSGTDFNDLTAYDLGRMAVAGLLHRTRIDPTQVGLLVMGTVVADVGTTNLGREVALGAGLPVSCPAYTVTVACVSSLQSAPTWSSPPGRRRCPTRRSASAGRYASA
jgi:acetyl-CoA acetyltransferase